MPENAELDGPSFAPVSGGLAKQLIIMLHGLGADGNDLIGLAPLLSRVLPNAQFLAPNGPEACDTAPTGYQWFSLQDRTPTRIETGVRAAAELLEDYIDTQLKAREIDDNKLALIGFSQGCMMALHVGLRRHVAPAAILGYSGMLVAPDKLEAEITCRPPVLLVHGEVDSIMPHQTLVSAQTGLKRVGVEVQTISRPDLGHSIDEEGIRHGAALLQRTLTV